jgi:hypothetical protein
MSGKDDKRVKNAEVMARLDAMEAKVDEIRVLAAKLEAKKRAALEAKVEQLEADLGALRTHATGLEGKLANFHATLKELVEASNASAVLSSCIERFLDDKFGENWDDGVRKEAERRAELLKKRRGMIQSSIHAKKMTDEERDLLASELWDVSTELDTRAQDVAMVISLYLQGGAVNPALDVVEEIQKDEVVLSPEVAGIVQQLVDRCREIAKGREDELQKARIERVPAIVDPRGRPISSK